MLRWKTKMEERLSLLLMNVSNQKMKREDPLDIRVSFASRTIGSEDTTFCLSQTSTAFFFFFR